MRAFVRIFLLLTVTALLGASCRKTMYVAPELILWLDIEAPASTKGSEGNVSADQTENAIKDLRIWIFQHYTDGDHSGDKAFAYFSPNSSRDPLTQYENRYHIPLPPEIAQHLPKIDVYVIGNPKAVGQNGLGENTERGTLDGLTMTGTRFGVNSDGKPACTAVPSDGLPYTGVAKGLSMRGSYPVMYVEKVKVRKAVSKFRFVFCQLRDESGPMIKNLQITGLTLNGVDGNGHFDQDGENISSTEYLFNDTGYAFKVDGYRTAAINFDPPGTIRRHTAPEDYVFNPPADPDEREAYAQQYETLIDNGVYTQKVLTEVGKCYLRETDKMLSGKVSYSIDGTPRDPVTFTMHAPGDFVRGRSWIVYVYFLREAMHFSVSWSGWVDGNEWSLTPIDPMRPS